MKKLFENWRKYVNEFEDTKSVREKFKDSGKKLIFNTEKQIKFRNIDSSEQPIDNKPNGLWYSCGTEWLDWTSSEMPAWANEYKYVHELILNPSEMIMINSEKGLKTFQEKYKTGPSGYMRGAINWKEVAGSFSGIEICPYIASMRWGSYGDWYYSWDVASGCVWNKNAIKSVKMIYKEDHNT